MLNFQDIPTGYESFNHNERGRVDEEGVNVSQEAEEEEAVVTSKPDGEVRKQHRVFTYHVYQV